MIKWNYQGERGFWISADGRFEISPIFIGRTTAQGHELRDSLAAQGHRVRPGFYTVAAAKAAAKGA